MTSLVISRYAALVAAGAVEDDPAQRQLVGRLDALAAALADRGLAHTGSALGRLFTRRQPTPPRGLYIWGPVGRGKTMLMDLFFAVAPVRQKRRVHFHAFMADVHARLHLQRQTAEPDPILPVADALAAATRLLAFDEFQVTDIADAMILGRLFTRLFADGVVVVATSNTPPAELYRGGLNRALFEPFIALLGEHLDVVELTARTDFRLEKLTGLASWHVPADAAADAALDAAFRRLAGGPGRPATLSVMGRRVIVPHAGHGVARFSFAELCERPLGAGDYLALAENYHTLVLDRVPRLPPAQRNERRRFIILVDTLYDHHVKLIASAEAEPQDLVHDGEHAAEFERTASRLIEMRGDGWRALPHGRGDRPRGDSVEGLVET